MSGIETGTDDLVATLEGGIATITLNRPELKNALSREILSCLGPLVARVGANPSLRALVLTGAGTAFCAGGDVKGFHASGGMGGAADVVDPVAVATQQEQQRAIVGGLRSLPVPVIAAMPGPAAGAGIGLALAADFRLGTSRTVFAPAFVGVGLPGDFGTAWQLTELLGRSKALEIITLGERIGSHEALRLGLLNRLVEDDDDLVESVEKFTRSLAESPRLAIAHAKRNAIDAVTLDLISAMNNEVLRHQECGLTDDHRDAVAAFVAARDSFKATAP